MPIVCRIDAQLEFLPSVVYEQRERYGSRVLNVVSRHDGSGRCAALCTHKQTL